MKLIPKIYIYSHIIGLAIFCVGIFLPYSSGLTLHSVNESSVPFEFANFHETVLSGYETFTGRCNVVVILLLSSIFFLTKKQWFKYLLIPIGILYILLLLLVFTSTLASFGKPHGDTLHIGFLLMFFGTAIGLITTAVKPS